MASNGMSEWVLAIRYLEILCHSELPNVILQTPSAKIKSYILSTWIMNTRVFPLTFNDIIDQGVKHLRFLGELHLQSRHQVNFSSSNPSGNVFTGAALGSIGSTDRQSLTWWRRSSGQYWKHEMQYFKHVLQRKKIKYTSLHVPDCLTILYWFTHSCMPVTSTETTSMWNRHYKTMWLVVWKPNTCEIFAPQKIIL